MEEIAGFLTVIRIPNHVILWLRLDGAERDPQNTPHVLPGV